MKGKTGRAVVLGALYGIGVGVVLSIVVSMILTNMVDFRINESQTVGSESSFHYIKSGTVLTVEYLIPIFMSVAGGICGWLLARRQKSRK
jgi:hypothetical protein